MPSVAPAREEMQELLLERILGELIYNPSEGVRAAACVWLVSLCRFTGRQPRLLTRLADIQEAFSSLLGDSSEIAQVGTCQDPCLFLGDMLTALPFT